MNNQSVYVALNDWLALEPVLLACVLIPSGRCRPEDSVEIIGGTHVAHC